MPASKQASKKERKIKQVTIKSNLDGLQAQVELTFVL